MALREVASMEEVAGDRKEDLASKRHLSSPEMNAAAPAETMMHLDPNELSFSWVGLRHDLGDGVEMAAAVG